MIDTGSGVLFPIYDPDTRMMWIVGKGDGNIRFYEIEDSSPYCSGLDQYKSSAPQRGVCFLPKQGCNVNACEIARVFKLHPKVRIASELKL